MVFWLPIRASTRCEWTIFLAFAFHSLLAFFTLVWPPSGYESWTYQLQVFQGDLNRLSQSFESNYSSDVISVQISVRLLSELFTITLFF